MKRIALFDPTYTHLKGLPFLTEGHYQRFSLSHLSMILKDNPSLGYLSRHLSGGMVFFRVYASSLRMHISYHQEPVMNHMSPLGEAGFDVYIKVNQSFVFYDAIRPFPRQTSVDSVLALPKGTHDILIYTPLYAGVHDVYLDLEDDEWIEPYNPQWDQRIVFYGTSITQGACASRPGMSYTNILTRMLHAEIINMGFSGQGLGERSVAQMIASIPKLDMVAIDYEANAGAVGRLKETLIPWIETIRMAYPSIPIVIISRIPFVREYFQEDDHLRRLDHLKYQKDVTEHETGLQPLIFIDGATLIHPDEFDMTVDGIHLNDVGMQTFANRIAPILNKWLSR